MCITIYDFADSDTKINLSVDYVLANMKKMKGFYPESVSTLYVFNVSTMLKMAYNMVK